MPLQLLGAIALMLHATLGIPIGDPARPRLLVTIHTEGTRAGDSALIAEAAATARDIWRPYVDVTFGRAGDIRRTIEVDQLDLIVTDRILAQSEPIGMGWIEFTNDQPSRTITVSTTAVEQTMASSWWKGRQMVTLPGTLRRQFIVRALGRSIAHEMGHYLLRSKTHTRKGLMRDHLSPDEIMAPRSAKDRLEPEDLKRLDGRLFEYAAALAGDRPPA